VNLFKKAGKPLPIATGAIWRQHFRFGAKKSRLAKTKKNPTFKKQTNKNLTFSDDFLVFDIYRLVIVYSP
jgi:hypothetical protein